MDVRLQEIRTARKLDELEELKNRLIKTQHRLKECDNLHKQYTELVKHWKSRDIRYRTLQRQYRELIEMYNELKKEYIDMKITLKSEMAKFHSTGVELASLQKRHTLLKASCKACFEKQGGVPQLLQGVYVPRRPPGTPPRGVRRPLPRARRSPRRLTSKKRDVFKS